jgi:hypothetical protein
LSIPCGERAQPGTYRLTPPDFRRAELERDYQAMRVMFIAPPPPFASVLQTVSDLECQINA